ncbi:stalk domain-containing protein [Paenibacillus maysiensis]|uniref:stalk domain-containing protein n=1 Tax=Paenibacillus maysiensis TaxID=1155954 RepID=UPI0004AEBC80|nr:stalk domain-containing protein [Paenibacillus maysiensis]
MELNRGTFQRLLAALFTLSILFTVTQQGVVDAAEQKATPTPKTQSTQLTTIVVNGQPLNSKATPMLIAGKLTIPLKPFAEAVGATYHWDVKKKLVTLQKWSEPVQLKEPSRKNQQQLTFEISGKEVYIPLRDVSFELGYTLEKTGPQIQVQPPIQGKIKEQIYEGDLAVAREALVRLDRRSAHPYIDVHFPNTEILASIYLFPQGEALRYFIISGDVLSLVEVKDGFPVVTYQGYVGEPYNKKFTMDYDPLERFLNNKVKNQWGTYPKLNKPLVYEFTTGWGDSSTTYYGRITMDHKDELLGTVVNLGTELPSDTKQIMKTFKLPWESRTDAK